MDREVELKKKSLRLISELTFKDFLLSHRITSRVDKPFTIFECHDFFPRELYEQLVEEFPAEQLRHKMGPKDLRARIDQDAHSTEFLNLISCSPAWSWVVDCFSSREFVSDLRRLFRRNLTTRVRPRLRFLRWLTELVGLPRVSVKFDFVMSRGGYHLTPHTDGTKKFFALMIYLPTAGRLADSDSMATLFWTAGQLPRALRMQHQYRLTSRSFPRVLSLDDTTNPEGLSEFLESAECFHSTGFRDNSLAGFVKSNESWHSVDLTEVSMAAERCTVLINLNKISHWNVRVLARRLLAAIGLSSNRQSNQSDY